MKDNISNIGVKGKYRIVKRKINSDIEEILEFDNLITNAGLDRLFTIGSYLAGAEYCQLGTGTAEPQVTDTTLNNYSKHKYQTSRLDYNCSTETPYYVRTTVKTSFLPGEATGIFTEIGMGWGTNSGLFSKSLIKDSENNPISLTVLADEYLDIYYDFYWYLPNTFTAVQQTINGVNTQVTIKPYNVLSSNYYSALVSLRYPYLITKANASSEALPADIFSTEIVSIPNSAISITREAYVDGSFERVLVASFGPNIDLTAGVRSVFIGDASVSSGNLYAGGWGINYDPPVTKTSEQEFKIRIKIKLTRM